MPPADIHPFSGDCEPFHVFYYRDAFDGENLFFNGRQISRIAGEATVTTNHPVARDVNRDRIVTKGLGDSAHGF